MLFYYLAMPLVNVGGRVFQASEDLLRHCGKLLVRVSLSCLLLFWGLQSPHYQHKLQES